MTTIAQISDVHVRPDGVLYQDVANSNAMLTQAIARLNGLAPRPDFIWSRRRFCCTAGHADGRRSVI